MAVDHSLTYRDFRLRNIPHILRLRALEKNIRRFVPRPCGSYADFGCSNGFVTAMIAEIIGAPRAVGFDHVKQNLDIGRRLRPGIDFRLIDLNRPNELTEGFDFVTCFETFEHVGNLSQAIRNVVGAIRPGGKGLLSVPIEIGAYGTFKYFVKMNLYRYSMKELSVAATFPRQYRKALLAGERISKFREPRKSWGTHFGFDYRDVDDILTSLGVTFTPRNEMFTRYYEIVAD